MYFDMNFNFTDYSNLFVVFNDGTHYLGKSEIFEHHCYLWFHSKNGFYCIFWIDHAISKQKGKSDEQIERNFKVQIWNECVLTVFIDVANFLSEWIFHCVKCLRFDIGKQIWFPPMCGPFQYIKYRKLSRKNSFRRP